MGFQQPHKQEPDAVQVITYNELLPELLGYTPEYVQSRTTFRAVSAFIFFSGISASNTQVYDIRPVLGWISGYIGTPDCFQSRTTFRAACCFCILSDIWLYIRPDFRAAGQVYGCRLVGFQIRCRISNTQSIIKPIKND